jgi:hypothetical protein
MKRNFLALVLLVLLVAGVAAYGVFGGSDEDSRPDVTVPSGAAAEHVSATVGFYTGSPNTDGLERFFEREDWLGHPIRFFTAFGEGSSLENFNANANGQFRDDRLGSWAAQGSSPPFRLVYSLPLAFGPPYSGQDDVARSVIQQWDALIDDTTVPRRHESAGGLDRGFYRQFARRLVDLGYGDAIIRLASEHDIQGARWASQIDYDRFKEAFRAVVDTMRSEAPDLAFDFNSILINFGAGNEPGPKVADAYPGDEWVDYIGINVYDHGEVPSLVGVPAGERCGWSDPDGVFETYHEPVLENARRYAEAHGKPLSFPEWGLGGGGRGDAAQQVGQCGGDNPIFIERMHSFFASLPISGAGSLGYHSYFEGNQPHAGPHALDAFPHAAEEFRVLFGPTSS